MKPIIPSFTLSERSIITPTNHRGWNMDIIGDPVAYFAPWQSAIKDAGAVFLLRPFGMTATGYASHTRTCYGGEAGKTFPCGPEWGLSVCMDEVIGQWCDDNVIVYLYCGGIAKYHDMYDRPLVELIEAAKIVNTDSGVPDHPNVRWVLDNEGEKDPNEITPTDYIVRALRAVGRDVLYEPAPRMNQLHKNPTVHGYCCLWNRQRAALTDASDNPIEPSDIVMVGGNKPSPQENLAQLTTPEARIAEAMWHISGFEVTVALATAGLTPDRWAKEVTP